MAAYATLALLKERVNVSDTSQDDILNEALNWSTAFIDSFCDRRSSFNATNATQYYQRENQDPDDAHILWVDDDLLTVTTLTNGDGTTIPNTEYWLEPRNAPSAGTPYNAIRLKSTSAWVFPTDGWVTVIGTWGYTTTTPDMIQGACLRLAEFHYRAKAPLSATTIFDGSIQKQTPEGFPTEILTALEPYRKLSW